MHRLLHAISAPAANASIQTRTTINGVAAICDPLGGLYLPEGRTLVVSDLHLEKGS
ncbi:metallophosphatase, partial [Pseudomonas syringae]